MQNQHTIVVISSHVVRGSVGNRAAVFALESLGFPVWAVPTIVLPWHPGHGRSTRIIPDDLAFSSLLQDLAQSDFRSEVRAILSGYMASPQQVADTAKFVAGMRQENPDLIYVCDPVIGDDNGLYVDEEIARAIRDDLLPLADIVTPNRFELAWLQDVDLTDNQSIVDCVRSSELKAALVTSAFGMLKDGTGNLYVDADHALLAEHRVIEDVPNGVGDLTAALFLARRMAGQKIEEALSISTQSVFELLQRTAKRGADELTIERDAQTLRRPNVTVQMRQIGNSIQIRRRT